MAEGAQYELVSILCEAGVPYWEARQIEKRIDRDCWGGITSRKLAARLWCWMEHQRDDAVARSGWVRDYGVDPGANFGLPDVRREQTLFTLAPKRGR